MTFHVEPVSRDELDDLLRDYVCSTCWGALAFRYEDSKWFAICPECGEETKGCTSKSFAERRRTESGAELIEAERNLRSVLGMAHERQTVDQNLRDLGF